MLPGEDGGNINGPSLISAPPWISPRLGAYYLYFAHHKGTYIRMAYADSLGGPWRVHEPGTLALRDCASVMDHVASPDVHVDPIRRKIVMYFHGPARDGSGQKTFMAASDDGLRFEAQAEPLGEFYFRLFQHSGERFAMAKGGRLYKAEGSGFVMGPDAFPAIFANPGYNKPGSVRHVAVDAVDGKANIYFSRIGDAPERILHAQMDLAGDWASWRAGPAREIARAEAAWEGAAVRVRPSKAGAANKRENQLRDPAIYVDEDGTRYLLYSVAGECGIALGKLDP